MEETIKLIGKRLIQATISGLIVECGCAFGKKLNKKLKLIK